MKINAYATLSLKQIRELINDSISPHLTTDVLLDMLNERIRKADPYISASIRFKQRGETLRGRPRIVVKFTLHMSSPLSRRKKS